MNVHGLFSLTTVLCAVPAQTTWVVDRFNRPGAHFTDLPAAVQAASSGDTLLLRATTSSDGDSYEAPFIQGKGMSIVGEAGGVPVKITGRWNVHSIPSAATVLVANATLGGAGFPLPVNRQFDFNCTQNQGSLILQNVVVLPFRHWIISPSSFTDCNLVAFSHCTLDLADMTWRFVRSKVMLDDTTVFKTTPLGSTGIWNPGLLRAEDTEVRMVGTSLTGPSAPPGYPGLSAEALNVCGASRIHVGPNCTLSGGFGLSRAPWLWESCFPLGQSEVYYDPSTQFIGIPSQPVVLIQTPQAGLRTTKTAGSVQVDQLTTPSAPTILLMAPLQTTPWHYVIGPVYLDPTNLWSDLAVAPATGPLTRSFTIPPTIPLGQWVGVQAFELTAQNDLLASNVTVVGIW